MIPGVVRNMRQALKEPGGREGQVLAQDIVVHDGLRRDVGDAVHHDGFDDQVNEMSTKRLRWTWNTGRRLFV